jgi:cbb3-type cytochrome c oxidase subunit III
MADKRIDEATGVETVGHEWDGIEELNTPLPRWWLWTFYACIAFAIGYVVVYPACRGACGNAGRLGWTSRGALAKDLKEAEAARAQTRAAIAATPIEQLGNDPNCCARRSRAGRRPSSRTACSATARARLARRAIPTSTTTTGCGAAISPPSTRRSSTASAIPATSRPA